MDVIACVIPKGALFTVTTGAYSDYTVNGVFRALEDIDVEVLRSKWLKDHPEQVDDYNFKEDDFLASISSLMETIECWELHLADYSCVNDMSVAKME